MSEDLLAKILNFTDADLKANRAGYMTEKQRELFIQRMKTAQRIFRVFLLLIPIVIVFEILTAGQTISTLQMIHLDGFIGIVDLGLAYVAYSVKNDNQEILASNTVETIQGAVWCKKRTVLKRGFQSHEYFVGSGDKWFHVNEQAYTIFVEGKVYTLYFIGGKLLSAERLFKLE